MRYMFKECWDAARPVPQGGEGHGRTWSEELLRSFFSQHVPVLMEDRWTCRCSRWSLSRKHNGVDRADKSRVEHLIEEFQNYFSARAGAPQALKHPISDDTIHHGPFPPGAAASGTQQGELPRISSKVAWCPNDKTHPLEWVEEGRPDVLRTYCKICKVRSTLAINEPYPSDAQREAPAPASPDQQGELREAAQALSDKLDVIHNDPRYQGIWSLAMIHGTRYTGPNYEAELKALRAALHSVRPQCEHGKGPGEYCEQCSPSEANSARPEVGE